MKADRVAVVLGAGALAWLAAAPATQAAPQTHATAAVVLLASPDGQGAACRSAQPCSLGTAQVQARRWAGKADVDVELAGGTYQLTKPLTFTAADSGTAAHPVVYQAVPGAQPIFSGGVPVTGWTLSDAADDIWSAPVPPGIQSRQLFVDGTRLSRTTGSLPGVWHQTATGYDTTDSSIASWRNPSNLELVFNMGNGFWTQPLCDVASVAPITGGTAITVRQPCWSNLHIPDTPAQLTDPRDDNGDNAMGGFEGISDATNPSSIENAYELFSGAGQFYLDQSANSVYYEAKPGEDVPDEDFVMPVQQILVDGEGTLDAPVQYLTLEGITFAYSTWLQPSGNNGFAEMQANVTLTGENASGSISGSGTPPEGSCQYTQPEGTCPFAAWSLEPAAVTFQAAHHVQILDDTFTHLGAAGLNIDYSSQDNLVQGNLVTDTSGSGIQLGNTNDSQPIGGDPREINTGNTIADNWIYDVGAEYPGAVGIWVGYTEDTTVAHNQIDNLPYTGISFGWGGWHTDLLHTDNSSISGHNFITDNLIYNYLVTLYDGGAIYTNGVQGPPDPNGPSADPFLTTSSSAAQMARGLTISGNVSLIGTYSEFAYYNDEGSDYITWYQNVEYQNHALATGGCDTVGHIHITDNYWAQPLDGYGGYICPPPPIDVVVTEHHIIPDHPGPGDIPASILENAGLQPAFRWLVTDQVPAVTGVGPEAGPTAAYPQVLVSGSGFTSATKVYFGTPGPTSVSPSVAVLSANYLEATPPSGATGEVDITVQTASGTSAINSDDEFVALP